jgi:hypothetical protein
MPGSLLFEICMACRIFVKTLLPLPECSRRTSGMTHEGMVETGYDRIPACCRNITDRLIGVTKFSTCANGGRIDKNLSLSSEIAETASPETA